MKKVAQFDLMVWFGSLHQFLRDEGNLMTNENKLKVEMRIENKGLLECYHVSDPRQRGYMRWTGGTSGFYETLHQTPVTTSLYDAEGLNTRAADLKSKIRTKFNRSACFCNHLPRAGKN